MPLSFACIFGGLVTIIGTSTNLVVQGLVIEAGQADPTIRGLGFFEPGYIGLPLGIVGMLYLAVAAPRVLAGAGTGGSGSGSGSGGGGDDGQRAEELLTEVKHVKEETEVAYGYPFLSCVTEDGNGVPGGVIQKCKTTAVLRLL